MDWGNHDLKKKNNKPIIYVIIGLIVVIILIAALNQKNYTGFANCLADKGYMMAGTETCKFCKTQKESFEGAFEEVFIPKGLYLNCQEKPTECDQYEIRGYPTWVLPDGNKLEGLQELSTLATISGCELP